MKPRRRRESPRGERSGGRSSTATTANGLLLGLLNIQSIKPKLLELSDVLECKQIDLLCLCETWLRPPTPNRLLILPDYRLYRADRPDSSGYGGVALVARDWLDIRLVKASTVSSK